MFSTLNEIELFFKERQKLGIKPGLIRIEKMLMMLDHPERKNRAIHVAGTNGKGSTIQFMQTALQANGYRTGVFTSPSFHGILGHIFLNGEMLSEQIFMTNFNEIYPTIKKLDYENQAPTEFEILTVLAFLIFSKNSDIVLLETGMGGRFDTTNTCIPILSIITNIAHDHTEYLGESLSEIAYHKAGIIKRNVPVILGEMKEEASKVVLQAVKKQAAPVYQFGKDFRYHYSSESRVLLWKSKQDHLSIQLEMRGEHQRKNVSLALQALKVLEKENINLDWQIVMERIAKETLPGRFEVIHKEPLVILDAAHNPKGIEAFLQTIEQEKLAKNNVIIGMFTDKDTETMLQQLANHFELVTVTSFEHFRAASAEELYENIVSSNKRKITSWQAEIEQLIKRRKSFYVTGSLHFITMVRKYFVERTTGL